MEIVAVQPSLSMLVLLPILVALIHCVVRQPNIRDALSFIISIGLMLQVFLIWKQFSADPSLPFTESILELLPGLAIRFDLEALGLLFALMISSLWVVTMLYSIGYMRKNKETHQRRFFCFFSLSIAASLGIAFSDNLLTLFIFYEMLTLVTYPLVVHQGDSKAKLAGRTYLSLLLGTSLLFFLPAICLTWMYTGTLDFTSGGILQGKITSHMAALLVVLYVFGVGKAAIMPFHRWLPAAMVAPAPVSALLHAVAVVKAGIFALIKIVVYVFGTDYLKELFVQGFWYGQWVVYLAGITIIVTSLIALGQDNLKKRLAYSTISQLSYSIMVLFTLSPIAIIAAGFHMVGHAVAKITLFFAAGSIYTASHKDSVSQLSGIGKVMPWTMTAFTIAALSMIGIPPTVGFISKWYMLEAGFRSEQYFMLAVLIISTILNAAYFLPIIVKAFFSNSGGKTHQAEAPVLMIIAILITAFATVGLCFYPDLFIDLANAMIKTGV